MLIELVEWSLLSLVSFSLELLLLKNAVVAFIFYLISETEFRAYAPLFKIIGRREDD